MRDHLLLFINGVRHVVGGREAFLSLSDFLRRRLGLIGTKIVCSEGDCGACTVLVGRRASVGPSGERRAVANGASNGDAHAAGSFRYQPVDACIQFMFQLDGAHVVTVEGLRPNGGLNAVQQAMIDSHGSQCGFCTPGFVMAMTGLRESDETLDADALRAGLTGNLCRCTGYLPIVDAGLSSNQAEHERLNAVYPPAAFWSELAPHAREPVTLEGDVLGQRRLAACPTTLAEALDFLAANPQATIVAGATDVGVRANKTHRLPETILDLNRIAELDYVRQVDRAIHAGARTTWTSLLSAVAGLPEQSQLRGELGRILSLFGAPQIRHVGTVAGNIANASPIADSLPLLFVMEATIVLASQAGRREVNVNDFYRGYKQLDLKPGELIVEVRLPLPDDDELLRLYKTSRRRDLDIAGFTGAVRMRLDGDAIAAASIALGAVGPVVLRARRTEAFLAGQPLTEATMRAAGDLVVKEISPIDDVRGSADYRRTLARNMLAKFYYQAQAQLASTP